MKEAEKIDGNQSKQSISKQLFFPLLLISLLLIAGFSCMVSPAFSIGNVAVEGNSYLSKEEVASLAGVPEKINIFRLNVAEMEERLQKDLRIEQVQVIRSFPSTVTLRITERQPLAYVACDYGFIEIDRHGMVIAAYRTLKNIQVPLITGIVLQNVYVGDHLADGILKQAIVYLASLNESALNQMSELNIGNQEQLVAYTNGSIQIRIGSLENLQDKAKLTQNFLEDVNAKKLSIEYVDFTYASPFIKMKN